MNGQSQTRPWLAALLTALVVGLGHIYLRKWRRALGWLLLTSGVTVLLSPASVPVYLNGEAPIWSVLPIVMLSAGATLDAYVAAKYMNLRRQVGFDRTSWQQCPNCNGRVDPSIDFCQWCAEQTHEEY